MMTAKYTEMLWQNQPGSEKLKSKKTWNKKFDKKIQMCYGVR